MRYRSSLALAAGLLAPIGCRGDNPVTTTYFANGTAVLEALRPYCDTVYYSVHVVNTSLPRSRWRTRFMPCDQFARGDELVWVEVQTKAFVTDTDLDVCAIRVGPSRMETVPPELIRAMVSDAGLASQIAAAVAENPDVLSWQTTVRGIRVIRSKSSAFSYVALEGCEVAPAEPDGI